MALTLSFRLMESFSLFWPEEQHQLSGHPVTLVSKQVCCDPTCASLQVWSAQTIVALQREAIRWSQCHSCQWRSALCSSSGVWGELEASSSAAAVGHPPPVASTGLPQMGQTCVWTPKEGVDSYHCCCDSSSEVECWWWAWSHILKAPVRRHGRVMASKAWSEMTVNYTSLSIYFWKYLIDDYG